MAFKGSKSLTELLCAPGEIVVAENASRGKMARFPEFQIDQGDTSVHRDAIVFFWIAGKTFSASRHTPAGRAALLCVKAAASLSTHANKMRIRICDKT